MSSMLLEQHVRGANRLQAWAARGQLVPHKHEHDRPVRGPAQSREHCCQQYSLCGALLLRCQGGRPLTS